MKKTLITIISAMCIVAISATMAVATAAAPKSASEIHHDRCVVCFLGVPVDLPIRPRRWARRSG